MSDHASTHHARVVWRGDRHDLRAHEVHLAGQTLEGSCPQALGGNPAKADPEAMFVAEPGVKRRQTGRTPVRVRDRTIRRSVARSGRRQAAKNARLGPMSLVVDAIAA